MASLRAALAAAGIGLLGVTLTFGPTALEFAYPLRDAAAHPRVANAERPTPAQLGAAAATATPTAPGVDGPSPTPTPSPTTTPAPTGTAAAPTDRQAATPTPSLSTDRSTPATPGPTMETPSGVPAPPPPATHENGKPILYLTFDDGPDPEWTPQILKTLAAHRARATFFVVGKEVAQYPALVQQVRRGGHTLGNHSYTHPWLTELTPAAAGDELARTDSLLGGTTCLRPPGGFVDAGIGKILADRGSVVELWHTDTRDWARPGADRIAAAAVSQLRPGVIVLMHDGGGDRAQTVAALATLLPDLSKRGYVVRPLPSCR